MRLLKRFFNASILLLGLSMMISSCSILEGGDNGGLLPSTSFTGTWDLVGINYTSSKHHNTFYKEWWVITDNTITYYDYENENQIDTFGPYEYKREGNDIHIKKGASYESYVSLKIVSVSKDILEMEHLGLGFQGDWCVATYKRSRGNKDDLKWVN